ncbi:MAG: Flp pilus assembly protein CpaB [Selenomonadaceae bacterium]|nr:Flp pilus assembly protein CpaB [Selenomonadaceae bacterium]
MFSKLFSRILDYLNNLNLRQVLTLAAIAAVLMFVVLYVFLTRFANVENENVTPKTITVDLPRVTTVVVAKSDIAPRVNISESMVQVKEVPSDSVPNGAITSLSEVIDKPARINILAGDIITKRKLYLSSEQSGFVGAIPPDCRAVSINVNNITGVAGFAKPGDYVDLLLVENNNVGATTSIILQNILLLSINQSMDRNEIEKDDNGNKNPNAAVASPSIATLALRPQEALKLVSAAKLGDIYLMLRPSKPTDMYVDEIDYTLISANAPPKKEEPVTPAQPAKPVESAKPVETPPADTTPKFEIIYGAEVVQNPNDNSSNKEASAQ